MKNISPQRFFLIYASFFGILISILTPPFQIPDEINHFYRAYQISEGNINAVKKDNRVGGYIPESLDEFAILYKKLTLNKYSRISFKEINETKKISLNSSNKIFKDFPNTALYTPVSYLPQALTIFIFRQFNSSPYYLLLFSRLVSLFFWILMIYFSIKIIPFQKWLFLLLAILPMSISVNSSINADIITNAFSFLLIAWILRCTFNKNIVSRRDLLIISMLVIFLALAKMIYVSLLFLFLIIPTENFKSIKHRIISFAIILILGIGSVFIGKAGIDRLYTPYSEYNIEYKEDVLIAPDANMEEQINFIMHNKKETLKIFVRSFFSEFKPMVKSYIGRLGWGDTQLPDFIIILSYLVIFFISFSNTTIKTDFHFWQRTIFFSVMLILLIAVMMSQYLTWDPVGSSKVYPLQGRYFIPVFPLIFLLFYNKKINTNHFYIRIIVVLVSLFLGFFTLGFLYNRFYYNYQFDKQVEIFCGADVLNTDSKILTNEACYSGKYSVKLNSEHQYGFSHKFNNIHKGDKLIVTVWQLKTGGKIVFQEDIKDGEYLRSSKVINKDKNWYQLESVFFAPKDFTENRLKVYIWYPAADSAYFDDFKIKLYRKTDD